MTAATSPAAERKPVVRRVDEAIPVAVSVRGGRFWLVLLARDMALFGVRDIKGWDLPGVAALLYRLAGQGMLHGCRFTRLHTL